MKQILHFKKQKRLLFLAVIVFLAISAIQLPAQVSGTVYQDLSVNGSASNIYGIKDGNELGVEGVTVTIFPGGATTTTASDATYSFLIANAPVGDLRVEFTWLTLSWLQSSPDGAMQNTSVQFVTAPAVGVDFGLHEPGSFVNNANPNFVIPGYVNGDPLLAGTAAVFPAIYKVNNAGTDGGPPGMETANYTNLAPLSEVGSVWGIGTHRSTNTVFAGAFIERHSGLGASPTNFGGGNLTVANSGEGSNADLNDTNVDTVTGVATVLATAIPTLGANNHSFDFAFGPPPLCPPTRCGTVLTIK